MVLVACIPLNKTIELLDVLTKLSTPKMISVARQLYMSLSSVALVSVALMVSDDML